MRIRLLSLVPFLAAGIACEKTPAPTPSTTAASAAIASASAAIAAASAVASGATGTASAVVASAPPLVEGGPAPNFSVTAHDGKKLSLASLKGKPVVVYFYPKDETPGCTVEAQSFRDAWEDLAKTGVTVIGVSGDNQESHMAFATHHKLPFHLVSDEKGELATSFGVPFRGGYAARQTFVIDGEGRIKKIYRTVDVSTHAAQIAADLR